MSGLQSFVVSLTPFDAAGSLDEFALRAHLQRLRAADVGVYLAGGGSGEAYAMTLEEIARVLEIGVEELQGAVPIRCMGMEPRTSQGMIELAKLVESTGIDTMQVYSLDVGHAKKPTDHELERYFRDILEEVKIDCVLSSNRSVGYFIPIEMMGRFAADYPHFVAINCSNPDLGYVHQLIDELGSRIQVLVGGPEQALQNLAFGGHGYLTTEGNLAPRLSASILEHYQSDDMNRAFESWSMLVRLKTTIGRYGGIRATKEALRIFGLPGGFPRKPRFPLSDTERKALAAELKSLGIKEIEGIA